MSHELFYAVFATIASQGTKAPKDVKEYFKRFKADCPEFDPAQFKIQGLMTLVSEQAKGYEELVRSHVTANFKPKTVQYLLVRMSDATDAFYIKGLTTSER